MEHKKNIPYYLITGGLLVLLKYWYTLADNNNLAFLLRPTDAFTGILTSSRSVCTAAGYYHRDLNIIIDRSCSGFNFWVLCFAVLAYAAIKHFSTPLYKMLGIPIALSCAYALTLLVNTSRIFVSIVIQHQTRDIFPGPQHLIHQAIGIATNLSFLILAYYLTEKLLTRTQRNAKLT